MKKPFAAIIFLFFLSACTPRVLVPDPEKFDLKMTEKTLIVTDGTALPLHIWFAKKPPEAVILALHGFNDYGQFFNAPGEFFAHRGIISYAYDQRGFGANKTTGNWAGVETYARDAIQAATAIKQRHPDLPLYLLGSSMGGSVAILATNKMMSSSIDGVILAAPAVWGRITMPWYQRLTLWIAAHILPGMTLTAEGLDITPSDNKEMLIRLGKDPLVIKETRIGTLYGLVNLMDAALAAVPALTKPSLILYGERDEVIPRISTGRMLRTLQNGSHRIALYEKGYHMLLRDLQSATVWKDIVAWIKDRNIPLPSRADRRNLKSLGIIKPRQ